MQKIKQTLLLATLLFSLAAPRIAWANEDETEKLRANLDQIAQDKKKKLEDVQSFRTRSSSLLTDLSENKDLAADNQAELRSISIELSEREAAIATKKEEQAELIKSLYISLNRDNIFLSLLTATSLSELFREQVYLRHTQYEVRERARLIATEVAQLEKDKNDAVAEREILLAQIDLVQNQLVTLKGVITETEEKIKDLEKNSQAVEAQILALKVPAVPENTTNEIVAHATQTKGADTIDFREKSEMTIIGSGTPHGLGMSQYGAKAMADGGRDYEAILTHYYQGTKLSTVDTDSLRARVKLSASPKGGKIIIREGEYRNIQDGSILGAGSIIEAVSGLRIEPTSDTARVTIAYKLDRFNTYRGAIAISGAAGSYTTINELPVEDYLKSVISGEMSASWHKEALKAQAVAARNYIYKNLKPASAYDICDTPACQVYMGTLHEFASTNAAVEETKGKVLKYGNDIITAYYFSSSGGWTENNENVWGGKPIPWLRGVASPGETSPYNKWTVKTLSKQEVERYLNSDPDTTIGDIESIEIIKRGVSGRVMAVKINGSAGEKIVTGKTFKYVINFNLPDGTQNYIKSDLFGFE